jgi:hypothetical protein
LQGLVDLVASSGAPTGTTLGQALQEGYIGVMEVIESIRGAVPDPLARGSWISATAVAAMTRCFAG